ncbi:MAG: heavy metal-binding domain-containing protein [Thermoplasmatota archaeon]
MIVVREDSIPDKRIVDVLGAIEANSGALAVNTVKSARKRLEKQAENMGANAIINYKIKKEIMGLGALATGTAVVVE